MGWIYNKREFVKSFYDNREKHEALFKISDLERKAFCKLLDRGGDG
jgi:hypothetical protein